MPDMDESVNVVATANTLPSRLIGDAILGQWFSSIEAAEMVCGPAREIVEAEIVHSAGPLAATHPGIAGGGGVLSICPTTASQWQEYCKLQNLLAWGDQAKQWTSPLILHVKETATELAKATDATDATDAAAVVQSRQLVRGLSDLSCEEPIDIAPPAASVAEMVADDEIAIVDDAVKDVAEKADASESPKFGAAALIGSGPLVATIEEAYLAYDLSPEDVIAMRMYPIDGPSISGAPISYPGARRTSIYGPVPNFQASGTWHQQVEPGIVVSTPAADAPAIELALSAPAPADEPALPEEVVQTISGAARWVVAAVQPDSDVRQMASATLLSKRVGEAILESPRPVAEPVDAMIVATSDVQATRLMQIELACNAALDVVKQQAARSVDQELPAAEIVASTETISQSFEVASIEATANDPAVNHETLVDAPPTDELVQAQAVATACDLAAESLERLAMSLRRAGDSLVRQAKANGGANRSLLR